MTQFNTSPLVTTDWLHANLSRPDLIVLDASYFLPVQQRNGAAEYAAAHIPGSNFFDIDAVADRTNPLPHMLPTPEDFAAAVGTLGIGNDTQVVVYDSNSFMASARLWWTFRAFGHNKVAVLDGGLERWKMESRPLDTESFATTARIFKARLRPDLVKNLEDMRGLAERGEVQMLDARSPGRFAGTEPEPRAGLRSGHIPGSRNLFFKDLIDAETGRLKTANGLAGRFNSAGIDVGAPVVTTCGTGVTAAILALGLYCLGNENAAVYDGSWTEWGARTDTPVATS